MYRSNLPIRMPTPKSDSSDDGLRNRNMLSKSHSAEDTARSSELSSMKSLSENSLTSLSSSDEPFKSAKHATNGFSRMEDFFLQNKLTDVTIIAGEKCIHAHKIILCSASDYFTALFMNNLKESRENEITFHEMDGDILQKLIHYCYSGKIDLHENTVESLMATASILQLNEVTKACSRFLEKQLHPSNCIGIGLFAHRQYCVELKQAASDYTAAHFMDVIQNQEFLELPKEEVMDLLSSDDLNVSCEEEIFKALMKWIEFNEPIRSKSVGDILKLVRLPLLEPAFLVDVVQAKPLLKNDPACQSLILEALNFHLLPERRSQFQSMRTQPRKSTVGILYAVGGMDGDKGATTIEEYNLRTNTWTSRAKINNRRLQFGAAIINSKIFIIGGRDGYKTLNTAECFDLKTSTWSTLPLMSTSRHGVGVAYLEGPIYAVGGHDGWSYLNTVERYDPDSKSWSYVAPMSIARSAAGVVVLNKKIYAVGGRDGSSCLKTVEQYDPHNNKWTLCSPMIKRRCQVGVGVLNGYLYAFGGHDAPASNPPTSRFDCVERYDPKTDSWTIVANMSLGRDSVGIGVLGNKLFVIGGYDGQAFLNLVEMYDPLTNEWKEAQTLKHGRAASCIVTVRNAKED